MSEMRGLDSALFSGPSLVKRGYTYALANIGKTVALITSIAVLLVTFGEIGFIEFGRDDFTASVLVMLVASYIIYFSLHDAGEGAGRETDLYRNSEKKYLDVRGRITDADVRQVREFLSKYTRDELEYRRKNYITSRGVSLSDYERYLGGESFGGRDGRIFRRASRMKAISLTPRDLIERRRGERRGELVNPASGKALRMILRMIPTTVGTVFTVSLMLGFKEGLTVGGVIESLVRLSALPIVALRAYAHGYSYASEELSSWIETKTGLIEAFLKEEKIVARAEA